LTIVGSPSATAIPRVAGMISASIASVVFCTPGEKKWSSHP
jgi:hypothetical protein